MTRKILYLGTDCSKRADCKRYTQTADYTKGTIDYSALPYNKNGKVIYMCGDKGNFEKFILKR